MIAALSAFFVSATFAPNSAYAVYVGGGNSSLYDDPSSWVALGNDECIGYPTNRLLSNRCSKRQIQRIWFKEQASLCFVDGPFKPDVGTPFVFTGGQPTGPGGALVSAISFIDEGGTKKTIRYGESAKTTPCPLATTLTKNLKRANAEQSARDKQQKANALTSKDIIIGFVIFLGFVGLFWLFVLANDPY